MPRYAGKPLLPILMVLTFALAGCSATSSGSGSHPRAASGWAGREDVGRAIRYLNAGDPTKAKAELVRVLSRQPDDAVAAKLLRQIETPAKELLGSDSFVYRTGAHDTMSSLAQRFLGDPLMFYALARYNGIAAPDTLAAGQSLRIPGRAAPARPARAGAKPGRPAPTPDRPVTSDGGSRDMAGDAGRATSLRAAALESMNRGEIDRAVSLLQEASRLDPRNPLIRRDLDRAGRIQKVVDAGR